MIFSRSRRIVELEEKITNLGVDLGKMPGGSRLRDGEILDLIPGKTFEHPRGRYGQGKVPASSRFSCFNPSTTISFSVPRAGPVSLKIFNVLGEEVATHLNGPVAPGRRSLTWNAGSLSSGVCFYQVRSGGDVLARRMILLQ